MYRSVFAAVGGLALLASTLFTPSIVFARRCPDEPPSTLLALYRMSDAIYVGKFDKSTEGKVIQEEETYKVTDVVENYTINTTLKGEPRKFFERHRDEYHYKSEVQGDAVANDGVASDEKPVSDDVSVPDEEQVEEEMSEEELEDEYRPLEAGDTVILFLSESNERDEGGKPILELAHYRDGVKRMPEASVSSYEARIKDLNRIFSDKKPDDAAIVAWLIRCIEDPVTRWEGAQVFLDGFEEIKWREEQAKEEAAQKEAAKNAEQTAAATAPETSSQQADVVEEVDEAEFVDDYDVTVYAELLTQAQKDALVRLAIRNTPKKIASKDQTVSMSQGDETLFTLVQRWGDYRLAAAMLEWLAVSGDNYSKSDLMNSIAEVLKDKELKSLSDKFSDATYQDDSEAVEDGEGETAAEAVNVTPSENAADAAKTDGAKSNNKDAAPSSEAGALDHEEKPKRTYAQFRSELMAKFVNRANVVLTNEKKAAKEKAKLKSKQAAASK